jgi:uncharacterized repeat protein (TIGR03803 family)
VHHLVVRLGRSTKSMCAVALFAAVYSVAFTSEPVQAQTYNILHTFTGGSAGSGPSDVIVAPDGTIYGAADYSNCACEFIFSITNGKMTVLHRFSEPPGNQAEVPQGLTLSKGGTILYGTTQYGGKYGESCAGAGVGCGIAFSYDLTTSKYKVMHEFSGSPNDGMWPAGPQVLTSNGDLYGFTWGGGTDGFGTLYQIASGEEKTLYSFGDQPDAEHPGDGITLYGGNFWGVSIQGGANTCSNGGCGAIYKIDAAGKESVVYSFTGGTDGQNPWFLNSDNKGHFYGVSRNVDNLTTVVFEINAKGQFSIIYDGSFASQIEWVTPGPNDTFYGFASGGNSSCGDTGCGQIFQLTPTGDGNGTVTILHQFDGTDGSFPQIGSLVLHRGILYGSTSGGGSNNDGVVFSLKP